jgi:hypothetical protein
MFASLFEELGGRGVSALFGMLVATVRPSYAAASFLWSAFGSAAWRFASART